MTRALPAVLVVVASLCACSPASEVEPRQNGALVRSTQFAPPPAPITDLVPTAEQLTVLFDASKNYSIREEDRAQLFDGPGEENRAVARGWGAQPSPQHIEFTTVESVGPDEVRASGSGSLPGLDPYPVGPIPFVRWNNEWKVPRSYVCGMLRVLGERQACG